MINMLLIIAILSVLTGIIAKVLFYIFDTLAELNPFNAIWYNLTNFFDVLSFIVFTLGGGLSIITIFIYLIGG